MKRKHKYKAWDSEQQEMILWNELTSSKHSDFLAAYLNGDHRHITMLECKNSTDRHGTEMYEGDIVIARSEETKKSKMFLIGHDEINSSLSFKPLDSSSYYNTDMLLDYLGDCLVFEICGDKFQSPELLE